TLGGEVGFWLMTIPAATVALDCVVTVPTTRPAFWIATVAAPCVRPTTFGIALFAGPIEIASATPVPGLTLVPAAGDWLITRPACTLLFSSVMLPTASPSAVSALVAWFWVRFTTFGTTAPRDTVKLIVAPKARVTPACGCWLITIPIGTVALLANSGFGVRSALVIAVAASACVRP